MQELTIIITDLGYFLFYTYHHLMNLINSCRNAVISSSIRRYGDTDFITGFRALAALAVLFIHSGGAGLTEISSVTYNFVSFCKNGVYVFFVISGFSVAKSYSKNSDFIIYLKRRLFRIIPLYYFWIFLTCVTDLNSKYWLHEFNVSIDFYNIVMHLLFISYLDYRIANTIIGVEWSIPIEVFWYLSIPLLARIFKKNIFVILGIPISVIYYIAVKYIFSNLLISNSNSDLILQWSPLPYLLSFVFGFIAFKIRDKIMAKMSSNLFISDLILITILCSFIIYLYFPSIVNLFYNEYIAVSITTLILIACGNSETLIYRFLFVNPIMLYLGTISYSICIYLSHFPIIALINKAHIDNLTVKFILCLFITIIVSTITFFTIEKYGFNICKSLKK